MAPIFGACGQDFKKQQYITSGEKIYNQNCVHCHQADGSGLAAVIPPVNDNYSIEYKTLSICGIKNGLSGEIEVAGQKYNGVMPASNLTNLEIAELITYINNSWGKEEEMTQIEEVKKALANCP